MNQLWLCSLDVILDTGSTVFWVASAICTGCGIKTYDPRNSTTAVNTNVVNPTISYGDGTTVDCTVYTDSLTFGDLSVKTQKVCVATRFFATSASRTMNAGILGLGNTLNDPANVADGVSSILSSFTDKIVSFYYDRNVVVNLLGTETKNAGEVTFGTPNSARFKGSLSWAPINKIADFWTLPITGASVGSYSYTYTRTSYVVMDTGSSLITIDQPVADGINLALGFTYAGSGLYTIDCTKLKSSLPTITITLGGLTFNFGAAAIAVVDPTTNTCISGVTAPTSANSPRIFGVAFLRNFLVAFDYSSGGRIGFAPSTDGWQGQGIPGFTPADQAPSISLSPLAATTPATPSATSAPKGSSAYKSVATGFTAISALIACIWML
eukprot:jgi/Hompol1/5587/HPOL_002003-RA